MPTYLAPGVYVEEVSSGSRPIEGAGTAVAAFVGFAEKGPFNEPTLCSNWTQFVNTFGGFMEGSLPGPLGLRILPERRGQLLHRAHRRRGQGQSGGSRRTAGPAADPAARRLPGHRARAGAAGNDISVETTEQTGEGTPDGHLHADGEEGRQGRGDIPQPDAEARQAKRRHRRQRPVEADPPRGDRQGPRSTKVGRETVTWPAAPRPRPSALRHDDYVGDPPTAPASAAWRPSTRSPWSACRT